MYEISVTPGKKLQPLFEGTVSVLGGEYALLDVELTPNDAVFFPPPIKGLNLQYSQSFDNYGAEFWLPVDFRIDGQIEIGIPGLRFPVIEFRQMASITDYEVNIPVPDSLYREERILITDTLSVQQNVMFHDDRSPAIPLSRQEAYAYEEIDSTRSLAESFEPRGFLSRFIDSEQNGNTSTMGGGSGDSSGPSIFGSGGTGISYKPEIRYNRVEALHLGLRPKYRFESGRKSCSVKNEAGV